MVQSQSVKGEKLVIWIPSGLRYDTFCSTAAGTRSAVFFNRKTMVLYQKNVERSSTKTQYLVSSIVKQHNI